MRRISRRFPRHWTLWLGSVVLLAGGEIPGREAAPEGKATEAAATEGTGSDHQDRGPLPQASPVTAASDSGEVGIDSGEAEIPPPASLSSSAPADSTGGAAPADSAGGGSAPAVPSDSGAVGAAPAGPAGPAAVFILPEEGDVIQHRDLKAVATLSGPRPAGMALLLDEYALPNPVGQEDGVVRVALPPMRNGPHTLTLLLFNEDTEIIGRREVRFFMRAPASPMPEPAGELRRFGRFLTKLDWRGGEASGRIMSLREIAPSGDTAVGWEFRDGGRPPGNSWDGGAEGTYQARYRDWEAFARLVMRSNESRFRQPAHRLGGTLRYGDWSRLRLGDHYPDYHPLVLNGTRLRGAEGGLALRLGGSPRASLSMSRGESRRYAPAHVAVYDTGGGTRRDTVPAMLRQEMAAFRLGFGGGPLLEGGLTVLKAWEEAESDAQLRLNDSLGGPRPLENLAAGLDFRLGLWDGRVQVFADWAASLFTGDRSLGAFHSDTFDVAFNPADLEDIFVFNASTRGWPRLLKERNAGLAPDVAGFLYDNSAYRAGVSASLPLPVVTAEAEIRLSHLGLDFHSEGSPYLDQQPGDGVTYVQRLALWENRFTLGMELGRHMQDFGLLKQRLSSLKGEIRYVPGAWLPAVWMSGGSHRAVPVGDAPHRFESGFLQFQAGGYHHFLLEPGKLHASLLYGLTRSDFALLTVPVPGDTLALPAAPDVLANLVTLSLQFNPRHFDLMPRAAYTLSHNGIHLPTHSASFGLRKGFLAGRLSLDGALLLGQYPETRRRNDLSLGEEIKAVYIPRPSISLSVQQKWLQYGRRRHVEMGGRYGWSF